MLAGTKGTLHKVTVEMIFSASIMMPVVHPAVGQFTNIFQNKILQFFVPKSTARRAAKHQIEHPIAIGLILLIQTTIVCANEVNPL
jgi:hypothetical protein